MFADLHAHYAMHLVPEDERATFDRMRDRSATRRRDQLRAWVVGLLGRFANYQSFDSGPRVTISSLEEGEVSVVLSVLYSPFDEMDLGQPYGAPPQPTYPQALIDQLEMVEADLAEHHADTAAVARNAEQLREVTASGKVAFVHCVEGGFHLGDTADTVRGSVGLLADRGVAYITLAHLFWRRVATNAPAIPFLPDSLYRLVFPQPEEGLTDLGRAALGAMVKRRVLIDLSHMSERSLSDALEELDRLDPDRRVPVFATHTGVRFGKQEYALSEETVCRIAARDGVIGLIFAEHQILDGHKGAKPKTLEQSVGVLCDHINRIRELTKSHRHVAIGSDLDGFIKPTLAGLQTMADMRPLRAALHDHYGPDAELICAENALRPLRSYWGSSR